MATGTTTQVPPGTFSRKELRALRTLRKGYGQNRDLFTAAEQARLNFLRWLYQSGRLDA